MEPVEAAGWLVKLVGLFLLVAGIWHVAAPQNVYEMSLFWAAFWEPFDRSGWIGLPTKAERLRQNAQWYIATYWMWGLALITLGMFLIVIPAQSLVDLGAWLNANRRARAS